MTDRQQHRPAVAVEPWDPSYGAPAAGLSRPAQPDTDTSGAVDVNRECPAGEWSPLSPSATRASEVIFVDGVRRIDARVWVTDDAGTSAGVAASFAAGAVRCNTRAEVVAATIERGLFSTAAPDPVPVAGADYVPRNAAADDPDSLTAAVQERMRDLELRVVRDVIDTELTVVDGPLRGRQSLPGVIGYIKSHRVSYLPPVVEDVVGRLDAGQRTPLFLTQTTWSRWSWYLRLPLGVGAAAGVHPWSGIVRCEAPADLDVEAAAALADQASVTLVGFASEAHKDGRAPQNLYPIAGLERHLRRLLGDQRFLYRQLVAATRSGQPMPR
ncbi:MAG: hypothetical protein R3343_10060 [Nitriliruptorales bacterium]|nr:hypothetical protein [Nitriliruptorales bacterium]